MTAPAWAVGGRKGFVLDGGERRAPLGAPEKRERVVQLSRADAARAITKRGRARAVCSRNVRFAPGGRRLFAVKDGSRDWSRFVFDGGMRAV